MAVRVWLQHLDPGARHHALYTDSQWVADGWNGVFAIDYHALHFSPWQVTFRLRDDGPPAKVIKTKARLAKKDVAHSPRLSWQRHGNALADKLAKGTLQLRPGGALVRDRARRTG